MAGKLGRTSSFQVGVLVTTYTKPLGPQTGDGSRHLKNQPVAVEAAIYGEQLPAAEAATPNPAVEAAAFLKKPAVEAATWQVETAAGLFFIPFSSS